MISQARYEVSGWVNLYLTLLFVGAKDTDTGNSA